VALSSAVVVALFVSFRALWPEHGPPAVAAVAPAPGRTVLLTDGSVVERLEERTLLRVVEDASSRSVVDLEVGGARFDVKPNPSRPFRVRAGPVVVEVLGTAFTVSREGGKVTTSVERGHVRVERGAERVDLFAGNSLTLTEVAETSPASSGASSPAVTARPPAAPSATHVPIDDWAKLAREGEYDRAYDAMKKAPSVRKDEPGELLLAADVARLSGHSVEAIAPLKRIVEGHSNDARAPLAAFTLGRVLLDEVGRPNEAAEMFARARSFAPDGPLAEDALAREVEAWWRAGSPDRAHARASEYVERFPSGAKLKSVRRFGGLE
jgi:transmembrane sensor